MKIRLGFVSNSSSASFTVKKKHLTPWQIKQILEILPKNGWNVREEDWRGDPCIAGYTIMDNFGIEGFAESIEAEKYIWVDNDTHDFAWEALDIFEADLDDEIGEMFEWEDYDLTETLAVKRIKKSLIFCLNLLKSQFPEREITKILDWQINGENATTELEEKYNDKRKELLEFHIRQSFWNGDTKDDKFRIDLLVLLEYCCEEMLDFYPNHEVGRLLRHEMIGIEEWEQNMQNRDFKKGAR